MKNQKQKIQKGARRVLKRQQTNATRAALAKAVRLFDAEASEAHPDPIDDGIEMVRHALSLLKA